MQEKQFCLFCKTRRDTRFLLSETLFLAIFSTSWSY